MYFGGPEYGMPFSKVDNTLMGVSELSADRFEVVIKDIMIKED